MLQFDPRLALRIEHGVKPPRADAGVNADIGLPDDGDVAVRIAFGHEGIVISCAREFSLSEEGSSTRYARSEHSTWLAMSEPSVLVMRGESNGEPGKNRTPRAFSSS